MPSASAGELTSYSIGRVDARESTSKAAERSKLNWFQRCQSGLKASVHIAAMNVANASLSHMPFHQLIVTKSPNHICASSCAITSAMTNSSGCVAASSSTSSIASRKVTQPRFSIAPNAKSGTATRSSLSLGYGMP